MNFISVESHEMVDVEDNKSPNHLITDAESDQGYERQIGEFGERITSLLGFNDESYD
jgi:hypothetical protein